MTYDSALVDKLVEDATLGSKHVNGGRATVGVLLAHINKNSTINLYESRQP